MITRVKINPQLREFLHSKKIYFAVNQAEGLADNHYLTIDEEMSLETNCLYTVDSFNKTVPSLGAYSYSASTFSTKTKIGRY